MYDVIGKSNPTYLLADPNGADVFSIPCEPKNGTVARGTVMVRKETGLWAPAATADVAETNQLAVLDQTVDTDAGQKVAEDAKAYRAGKFIYGKVNLKAGAALTAAHLVVLRKQGFVFDRMAQTNDSFQNEVD